MGEDGGTELQVAELPELLLVAIGFRLHHGGSEQVR